MGTKVTVDEIEDVANSSGLPKINENFDKVADEFDLVLYADGSIPATGDIDMDSNRILNLPLPLTNAEPITRGQIDVVINEVIGDVQDLLDDEVAAAEAARAEAVTAAGTATTQAGIATTKASEADASADSADADAATATAQAGIATTQAGIATTQAGIATTGGTTATTQAGIATTQAGISTTQAGIATTQAGIATSAASTATTDAATATTQAGIATAAASSVLAEAPSYSNSGGTGDRTSQITVTLSSGLLGTGTANNLVDGATTANTTDSVQLAAVTAVGASIEFDFGAGASKVVTEVTWKQSNTSSHGTWKWQGSYDRTTWTDIGSTFTLGGATTQVQTTLSSNLVAYRSYRLLGTAGTASASPFVQEVEFKIARRDSDTKIPLPAGGGARDTLYKTSTTSGEVEWRNPHLGSGFPTATLASDWEMVTADGTTVKDRFGNNDITLASSTNVTVNGGHLSTLAGKVQTPTINSVTTVVALVQVPRYAVVDSSRTGFIISMSANGSIGLQEINCGASDVLHLGGMQGSVHPAPRTSAGTAHLGCCTGHWRVIFYSPSAAQSGPIAFGGRATMTSSTISDFKIMRASVFTGAALSDAERQAIYNDYRRTALKYGAYLAEPDCGEKAYQVVDVGESNCDGRADIADLSAADQVLQLPETLIMPANGGTYARLLQPLILGLNEQVTAPTVDFGPAFGLAKACRQTPFTNTRRLVIGKMGVGGTRLAPSSVGGTTTTTWSTAEPTFGGLIWKAVEHEYAVQAACLKRGIGPRFAGVMFAIGLNDAVNTIYASSDTVYQGYLQNFYNFWVTYGIAPATGYKFALFQPHTTDPVSDPTALANIRSACALFAAAQTGVTNISTDAYTKEPDNVHWDAPSMLSAGSSAKTAFAI